MVLSDTSAYKQVRRNGKGADSAQKVARWPGAFLGHPVTEYRQGFQRETVKSPESSDRWPVPSGLLPPPCASEDGQ